MKFKIKLFMDFISIFCHVRSNIKSTIIQDRISYWKLYSRRIIDVNPMYS